MGYRFLVAGMFFFFSLSMYGQRTAPKDINNDALLEAQRWTAYKFMAALEDNQIEKAVALIDSGFTNSKSAYRDSLRSFARELSKYKDSTQPSIVIVWPERGFNTYRCRYYNTNGVFFYMDLFLSEGSPFSRIQRITKIPESALEKDRREQAKYRIEHQNDTALPVPPPRDLSPDHGRL